MRIYHLWPNGNLLIKRILGNVCDRCIKLLWLCMGLFCGLCFSLSKSHTGVFWRPVSSISSVFYYRVNFLQFHYLAFFSLSENSRFTLYCCIHLDRWNSKFCSDFTCADSYRPSIWICSEGIVSVVFKNTIKIFQKIKIYKI